MKVLKLLRKVSGVIRNSIATLERIKTPLSAEGSMAHFQPNSGPHRLPLVPSKYSMTVMIFVMMLSFYYFSRHVSACTPAPSTPTSQGLLRSGPRI